LSERGLAFHLENDTAFDETYSEAESEYVLDIFG
jgi:hypothetical protein